MLISTACFHVITIKKGWQFTEAATHLLENYIVLTRWTRCDAEKPQGFASVLIAI